MAVKKNGSKNKHRLRHAVRSKTRRLRAATALPEPLTALDRRLRTPPLTPDRQGPRLADEFAADVSTDNTDRLPSLMLVITILAVLYIALITWFVARMPAK